MKKDTDYRSKYLGSDELIGDIVIIGDIIVM